MSLVPSLCEWSIRSPPLARLAMCPAANEGGALPIPVSLLDARYAVFDLFLLVLQRSEPRDAILTRRARVCRRATWTSFCPLRLRARCRRMRTHDRDAVAGRCRFAPGTPTGADARVEKQARHQCKPLASESAAPGSPPRCEWPPRALSGPPLPPLKPATAAPCQGRIAALRSTASTGHAARDAPRVAAAGWGHRGPPSQLDRCPVVLLPPPRTPRLALRQPFHRTLLFLPQRHPQPTTHQPHCRRRSTT